MRLALAKPPGRTHKKAENMNRITNFIVAAVIVIFNGGHADAQYFVGPVALASGGSGTAAVLGSESSFINPALAAHMHGHYMAGFATWTEDVGPARSRDLAVSLGENSFDSVVATAYGFVRRNLYDGDSVFESQDFHQVSFGKPIASKMTLGIQVSYLQTSPDPVLGGLAAARASDAAGVELKNWNGSIGILYLVHENMGLGFVRYNLGGGPRNILPSKWATGVNYLFGDHFRARVDATYTEAELGVPRSDPRGESYGLHTGLETLLGDVLWIRAGFSSESRGWHERIHIGLGWSGPKLAMEYAYRKDIRSAEQWIHGFDLRFYF